MTSYLGPYGSMYVFVRDIVSLVAVALLYTYLTSVPMHYGFDAGGSFQVATLGVVAGMVATILLYWIVADGVRIFLRIIMTAPSIQS